MTYYTLRRLGGLTILPSKKKFDRFGGSADTVALYLAFNRMWEDRDPKTNVAIFGPELIDTENLSPSNLSSLKRCEWGVELGLEGAIKKLEEWLAENATSLRLTTVKPKRSMQVTLTEEEMNEVLAKRKSKGIPVAETEGSAPSKFKQGPAKVKD